MIDNSEIIDLMQFDEQYEEYDKFFNSLCDRAKQLLVRQLIFDNIDGSSVPCNLQIYYYENIIHLTPIEQIFYVAYLIFVSDILCYEVDDMDIPFNISLLEELSSQTKIKYKNKTYIADFVIDYTRIGTKGTPIYPRLQKLKYVIELDGYDYHCTKKQMQNDYERENNLKELGYKVVRFTGSQIYKEPYTCIEKLINIIVNDIEKELKN